MVTATIERLLTCKRELQSNLKIPPLTYPPPSTNQTNSKAQGHTDIHHHGQFVPILRRYRFEHVQEKTVLTA